PTFSPLPVKFAVWRSASLLSEFGLGHVQKHAPFTLILSALHLVHPTTSTVAIAHRAKPRGGYFLLCSSTSR
ncbi:hypothetical protein, partial [Porphyromonas somerae]|uniref:hypothetical protein n=1 Tax=Porphyromonas somerae TaxID=322095 RepID=UPI002A91BD47